MSSDMKLDFPSRGKHYPRGRKGKKNKGKDETKVNTQDAAKVFSPQVGLPKANNFVPDNQVFRLTQSVEILNWVSSSATVPVFAQANFNVGQLDQITSLAAIFDQYRIDQVEIWWIPHTTSNPTQAAANGPGLAHSVIDYDDSNALTTIGQALDYTNCVAASGVAGHYRRFKPHVAVAAYQGTFAGYSNVTSPWLDLASTTIQHYGFKIALSPSTVTTSWDLLYRLHCSFRNVR